MNTLPTEARCIFGNDGEPLIAAAQSGNISAIKHLLDAGADIDHVNKIQDTAICAAIRNQNVDVLKYLLSRGGNVQLGSPSALMTAIYHDSFAAVEICINAGADVLENMENDDIHNPLIASLFSHQPSARDIFAMVVEHGAGIHYYRLSGQTLPSNHDAMNLSLLVQKNCVQQAKRILEADAINGVAIADAELEYLFNKNTVHYAIKKGFARFLEMMLLHLGLGFKDYTRILEISSLRGSTQTLKTALNGWKTFGENESMGDSLLIATVLGNHEKASLLLEHGADPENVATNGWSPLRFAVANGMVRMVDMFRHGVLSPRQAQEVKLEGPSTLKYSSPWLPLDIDLEWPKYPKGLVIADGKVSLAADSDRSGLLLHGDRAITTTSGLLSISVSIISASPLGNQHIHIGLGSFLTIYDLDVAMVSQPGYHPQTMLYSSHGVLSTYKHRYLNFGPKFTVGDTVGCIWDVNRRVAWFTVNGKKAGSFVKNVRGLLTPVVYVTPGTEVTATFGEAFEMVLGDSTKELEDIETEHGFESINLDDGFDRFYDMIGEQELGE